MLHMNNTLPSYNSCRNRHCPKCQTLLKERWIENQSFDLLNIRLCENLSVNNGLLR